MVWSTCLKLVLHVTSGVDANHCKMRNQSWTIPNFLHLCKFEKQLARSFNIVCLKSMVRNSILGWTSRSHRPTHVDAKYPIASTRIIKHFSKVDIHFVVRDSRLILWHPPLLYSSFCAPCIDASAEKMLLFLQHFLSIFSMKHAKVEQTTPWEDSN